jgi:hypothetical protein
VEQLQLQVGDEVVVHSLPQPLRNGRVGFVHEVQVYNGRYVVKLQSGRAIWLTSANLAVPIATVATIAIAALCQAIAAKLFSLYEKNLSFRHYRRSLLMENKWRAVRYGLDGKLIDFGKQREMSARALIIELLAFVDDVVDDLGSRRDLEYVYNILENGSGADRQLRVFRETGSMQEVAKYIHTESMTGLFDDVTPFIDEFRAPTAE